MKTIIATSARGEILAEVTGGREEAIEHLLSQRKSGCFLLLHTDREPGRIEMEWLLIARANSREASVSYASCPATFNWTYLDHFNFPKTLRETVTDAVHELRSAVPAPRKAPQVHQ